MLPIKDINPTRTKPIVTKMLVAINVIIFIMTYFRPDFNQILYRWGAKPYYILHGQQIETIFTSMFLHVNFLHIGGNMLYLWIFGDNVEDSFGHFKFLIFYLASGVVGTIIHSLTEPFSKIPGIGASGAISGVMGAYLVLFPGAEILSIVILGFIITTIPIRAYFFVGFWFLLQLLYGMSSLYFPGSAGIAYWAHIGGFIFGLIITLPFRRKILRKREYFQNMYVEY